MATLAELKADRTAAGAAYAAAARAYVAAWAELAAHDSALTNANVGALPPGLGFNQMPDVLAHSEFLPAAERDALVSPNAVVPARNAAAERILRENTGVARPQAEG